MDVLLALNEDGPDLVLEAGDLAIDSGLSSAVLLSLLVDRRASTDDLVPPDDDPRGWPLEPVEDRWGSKLWLLERGKGTPETLALARAAVLEALRWLVDDGIAETIDVRVELGASSSGTLDRIFVEVDVVRGRARRWPHLWEGVERGEVVREVSGTTLRILYR